MIVIGYSAGRFGAAELLVIGIRHRSPVGKLLLECPKPVLAVKPAAL